MPRFIRTSAFRSVEAEARKPLLAEIMKLKAAIKRLRAKLRRS